MHFTVINPSKKKKEKKEKKNAIKRVGLTLDVSIDHLEAITSNQRKHQKIKGDRECLQRRVSGTKVKTHIKKQMPLISSFNMSSCIYIDFNPLCVLETDAESPLGE